MNHLQCNINSDSLVNLFLFNSSELSAKLSDVGMNCWLHIGLEHIHNLSLFNVNDHYGKLNDFLETQVVCSLLALAFKVINAYVVQRGRVQQLVVLHVRDTSEEFHWQTPLFFCPRAKNDFVG